MTQADLEMKQSWRDKFDSAMNAPKQALQSMQTPPFAQNSAVNNFGYNTGLAAAMGLGKALGVFGVSTEDTPNAGINTDMSQAQSNAIWNNAVKDVVAPNSALYNAMQLYGNGNTSDTAFNNPNYINEMAKYGNADWNNARTAVDATDALNNQFNFNRDSILDDYYKKQGIGSGYRRW